MSKDVGRSGGRVQQICNLIIMDRVGVICDLRGEKPGKTGGKMQPGLCLNVQKVDEKLSVPQ